MEEFVKFFKPELKYIFLKQTNSDLLLRLSFSGSRSP